jgi:ABC-type branched-subunit amino acid transport system ATPase component
VSVTDILRLDGISKQFGGVVAVEEFSLNQAEGQISGIIGPNGAGKTTVFNLVTGVYPVDRGRIFYGQREITRLPTHRRTDLGIGRTFQNIRLFRNLSVLDNLKVAHDMKVRYTVWEEMFRLPRVAREERQINDLAHHYLDYLQLSRFAELRPANLPYGIQRRLELARALMTEPKLLLLDEPAAGLNPQEVRTLVETIRKVRDDHGLSIIIVEHHMELIMNICSLIHVLDFGKKIAAGRPEEIKKDAAVLQAYLGDEG